MTFTIAIAGKGGVGKSTIAALLVRVLHERTPEVVLAVDADPNSNLGEKLGVSVERTIGDLREELLGKADELPAGASKHDIVRYNIQMAKVEGSGFDLITMGRPEGPGCYCYINNILRTFLDELVEDYRYVVIDNEAGMEHLSRRTTRRMDLLVVVADATKVGIETAVRLLNLAAEMKIHISRTMMIVNRVRRELPRQLRDIADKGRFDEMVVIPHDETIEEMSLSGRPLMELDRLNATYLSVLSIAGRL